MRGETRSLAAACLLLATALVSSTAALAQSKPPPPSHKRMVCWTDDAGRKSCGDALPSNYADKQRTILDGTGRAAKVIPGAMTAEQRAVMDAKARDDAAAQRVADQQAAHDRALLATYATPKELAALRDDRLSSIDTSIELSEAAVRRDTVSLAELRARLPASGAAPNPRLTKQIAQFEDSLTSAQRLLGEMRTNREALCNSFTRDIARFQELKNGTVTYSSPCPAPGSLSTDSEPVVDVAGARSFFIRFAEMENDFDPALLDSYADNAVIKVTRVDEHGKSVIDERSIADYRTEQVKTLPLAKQKLDSHQYSDIKVEPGKNGRAMVSGKRISALTKTSTPFYVVVKPTGHEWKIVEAGSQPPP